MNTDEKLEILGRAFAYGEHEALVAFLNPECKYNSDYAHRRLTSAEMILENMKKVHDAVIENNAYYSYEVVELEKILNDGIKLDDLIGDTFYDVNKKGLLLYQNGGQNPVAVVFVKYNPGEYITEINLSREHKWFSISFDGEESFDDSEKDIPYTVKPMSNHDRIVKELQDTWTHQRHGYDELDDSEVYIWRQSDKYIKQWLNTKGYQLLESQVFDECIGYRCSRGRNEYTIYMFAYGQEKTTQLDGDYCKRLTEYTLSDNSIVLVVYLNVRRSMSNGQFSYQVCNYAGDNREPELWHVGEVNGKWILEYYPSKEMQDLTYRLMYAFNRDNRDVYDHIICEQNPAFNGLDHSGTFMNAAFFNVLFRLHKEYGDMKIGYVRFNDVIYSEVPYIEGYGYFSFSMDNSSFKINGITAHAFDDESYKYKEFIKTDKRESSALYDNIPEIVSVEALPPVETERFALKLSFNNGLCRKYILSVDAETEKDEVISYCNHVFTDKIWRSAQIKESVDCHRGKVIEFSNGFFISVLKCFLESEFYSEPEICNETLYEDLNVVIKRNWKWNVNGIHEDSETGIIKTLISGQAFNYYGTSTFASRDGGRLSSISFDYIDSFSEGLAVVAKAGHGFGYVDSNMRFVIPMQYDNAESFKDGRAKVKRGDVWLYIDKDGKEIPITPVNANFKYQDVGEYSEGMCKVSTLKLGFMDLAYHSDYSEIAGKWGFVNESGVEVIPPQFIYAQDFYNGIALVCKGEWTIDKKWDNKHNSGKYWTEEELWGAIDKDGNEVIPCIFDEIKHYWDEGEVFAAHYGGWENGHWGIIDNKGNWLAEPQFEDIGYEYCDGLFTFYDEDKWGDPPIGIYDIKQQKVIFEPQFLDVDFLEDGLIEVEVYDETLGRTVERIIDRNGKEIFHSIYSSIHTWDVPYEVLIRDENGERRGLIDKEGNIIVPCEFDIPWNCISGEQRLLVFKDGDKQGLRDFDGNVLIPPMYYELTGLDRPFLTVRVGEKENYKEGLVSKNGVVVLPAEYNSITWCRDNYIICKRDRLCEMLQILYK